MSGANKPTQVTTNPMQSQLIPLLSQMTSGLGGMMSTPAQGVPMPGGMQGTPDIFSQLFGGAGGAGGVPGGPPPVATGGGNMSTLLGMLTGGNMVPPPMPSAPMPFSPWPEMTASEPKPISSGSRNIRSRTGAMPTFGQSFR